jgi:glutathione S-transferase
MTQKAPILYSFRRCPYAMRARLALAVSGQSCLLREVFLRDRPEELYEVSPKGTVPVLVLSDGRVLEQSLDIMQWTLSNRDPEDWLPPDQEAADQTKRLIDACDGDFKHSLDRYKYSARHKPEEREEHREAAAAFLRDLNTQLAHAPFLLGNRLRMVDQALAPFVRQFAMTDKDWFNGQAWPHLALWLETFLASPLLARVMHKHDVWKSEDAPLLIEWQR